MSHNKDMIELTAFESKRLLFLATCWIDEYKGTRYCSEEDVQFVDEMKKKIDRDFNPYKWNDYPAVYPPSKKQDYLVVNEKGERDVLTWIPVDDICADSIIHWWYVKWQWSDPNFNVKKFHTIPKEE